MKYVKTVLVMLFCVTMSSFVSAHDDVLFGDEYAVRFADDMMRLTNLGDQEFETTHVEWSMPNEFEFNGSRYKKKYVDGNDCVYLEVETGKELVFHKEIRSGAPLKDLIYALFLSYGYSSLPGSAEEQSAGLNIEVCNKQMVVIKPRQNKAVDIFYNDLHIHIFRTPDAYELAKALLEAGMVK